MKIEHFGVLAILTFGIFLGFLINEFTVPFFHIKSTSYEVFRGASIFLSAVTALALAIIAMVIDKKRKKDLSDNP